MSAKLLNPTLLFQDPHRGNQPHSADAHDRENGLQAQRGSQRRPDQPRMPHAGCLLLTKQENEETLERIQGEDNTWSIFLTANQEAHLDCCITQTLFKIPWLAI